MAAPGWWIRFLAGPAAFVALYLINLSGLSQEGRVALATFVWAIVWWMLQPIPLGVTALLPLVVFPVLGTTSAGATASLYGQSIFFWILGTTMLGYAMQKHGLAKRFSLWFLGLPGVAGSTPRLVFVYMLTTALVSMFVSDTATVALMIPIGMSICAYVQDIQRGDGDVALSARGALASSIALGTLYAAQAGGVATLVGIPHNALAASLAERITGQGIGWFQWMLVGFPLSLLLLVSFYGVLRYFFPPELASIPGGEEFIREQASKLGKWRRGEVNALLAFLVMLALFALPTAVVLLLGPESPVSLQVRAALPIWVVPPIVFFLLFVLPVGPGAEGTLVWADVAQHAPWNIMLLCAGAVAMTDALANFGFIELVNARIQGVGLGSVGLPFLVASIVAASTNLISGLAATSLYCNIFIPVAMEVGFNPISMAMLIANVGLGIMLPWAGAAAGTAFATGYLDMREMVKVGFFATLVLIVVTASVHILFSPIL